MASQRHHAPPDPAVRAPAEDAPRRQLYPRRDREMRERYGFGLPPVPRLREARVADWRLVRHVSSFADGYASGAVLEPPRSVLYQGRTAWMSSGLMELESHAWHVEQASGVVVAAGLGIGLYAYACCVHPAVERIIVLELDPAVIALFEQSAPVELWPGREKLTILNVDALSEQALAVVEATAGRRPDYLFVDIWPTLAAPEAAVETAMLVARLRPHAAGWWGQELSFGQWCGACGCELDAQSWDAFRAETAVPLPASDGYLAFCRDVAAARLPKRRQADAAPGRWRRLLGLLGRGNTKGSPGGR